MKQHVIAARRIQEHKMELGTAYYIFTTVNHSTAMGQIYDVWIRGRVNTVNHLGEVRTRTLFVLSSSNRGRLLGITDLMIQKSNRMKQKDQSRHYGILQAGGEHKDCRRY
ncbi:hypothetical protein Tco_1236569 [Tanacetum coccineum]